MSQIDDGRVAEEDHTPIPEANTRDTGKVLPATRSRLSSSWLWLLVLVVSIILTTLYVKIPDQRFGITLLGAGLLIAIILLKIPRWQVAHLKNLKAEELFEQENEARKTVAQIVGGILILAGLYYTQENIRVTQEAGDKSRELTREGQITDRFTKAVGQLAEQKMEVRLGGIFALERIARESEYDQGPIMQILTSYLQDKAPSDINGPVIGPLKIKNTEPDVRTPYMPIDTQAILDVIGRRPKYFDNPKGQSIQQQEAATLSYQDRRRKVTTGEMITIFHTALGSAQFVDGHFESCTFQQSDLTSAYFNGAFLQRAIFDDNRMKYAAFGEANLRGSMFTECDLREADFSRADLRGAGFMNCDLGGATFGCSDLRGAHFTGVMGLNWEQLRDATIDETTRLPNEVELQRATQKSQ